jgi:maleylpyruvate isomerase
LTDALDEARAALRLRQGVGARYDAQAAPACELDWARRGTAYFARLLNDLSERELDEPSRAASVPRRWVVAYVGLEWRLLGELIGWLRAGSVGTLPSSPIPAPDRIRATMSLPDRALRNLFVHAAVHLDVEWRDLDDGQWNARVECQDGSVIELGNTPLRRAQSLWARAIDLRAGGRTADLPSGLLEAVASRTVNDREALLSKKT